MAMKPQLLPDNVDLSYKDDAHVYFYDIEALPSLFTVVWFDRKKAILWFYGSHAYDHVSDESLLAAFSSYFDDPHHREMAGVKEGESVACDLVRIHEGNTSEIASMCTKLARFANSQGIDPRLDKPSDFCEYVGWNSSNYDLPMLLVIGKNGRRFIGDDPITPLQIRKLSDALISVDAPVTMLGDELGFAIADSMGAGFDTAAYKASLRGAYLSDGHIDVAKMLRSADGAGESRFPPGLKKQEAKLGMDIVADEAVSISDEDYVMGDDELFDFIRYNLHDVVATAAMHATRDVKNRIFVRDIVRKMYPYTAAKAYTNVSYCMPPERDITEAQLTALSLIGPNRVKPEDYAGVSYEFPVPVERGSSEFKTVDLLDYMRETEPFMPDDLYAFFSHWRGHDTLDWNDFFKILKSQPVTHGATANIPYYELDENGSAHPIDAFIRVSTGGAHGSVMAGLSKMSDEDIAAWTRADTKPKPDQIPTLDLRNIVHADFTSYYPYLMTKMGAFLTSEGIDRYSGIYEKRVGIKEALMKTPDKSTWGPEQRDMSDQQLGLKLQLNSATGKANTHKPYALLPLDNKILSMRLIGNMAIWCLAQRMVHAGGYIVSTNTDGIYVANLTVPEAQTVIDDFVADYGILVDPEDVARFINRDTSNRMEFIHLSKPNDVRGLLRSASKLVFNDMENGHDVTYPLAVGNAVVRYISEDMDWLRKPYDRERMRSILEENRAKTREMQAEGAGKGAMAWIKIQASNSKNRLLYDGKRAQKVDRVALVTDGKPISQESYRRAPREKACAIWMAKLAGAATLGEVQEMTGILFDSSTRRVPTSALTFARRKKGKGRRDPDTTVAVECDTDSIVDEESFMALFRDSGATCLGYVSGRAMEDLKVWSPTRLSNYPDGRLGVLLDSAHDLREFDLDRLDMDGYLMWAESILKNWKVGGELVGNVIEPVEPDPVLYPARKGRTGKRAVAEAAIDALYHASIARKFSGEETDGDSVRGEFD